MNKRAYRPMQDTMNFPMPSPSLVRSAAVKRAAPALLAAWLLLSCGPALAQAVSVTSEPWVQVEVTLFTYENANLEAEVWSPEKLSIGFPDQLLALHEVADVLQLDDWSVLTGAGFAPVPDELAEPATTPTIGPRPYAPAESFVLPDLSRDAFHALPPSAHDFLTTNRTLSQSPAHRIVYHNAWRQPLQRRSATPAVGVRGGREFGERSELEGSIIVHVGSTRDRMALETNLWLTQFGTTPSGATQWELPVLPAVLRDAPQTEAPLQPEFSATRIIQFNQSREMRLEQFHYLDHPALGMLVQVTAYERPAPPVVDVAEEAQAPVPPQPSAP